MDLGELANNPLAQLTAGVLSLAGGWRIYRSQSIGDAKERADGQGQIAALDTWKQLLEGERAARIKAEERADKFAEERNTAMQEVWEMRGTLKAMNETLSTQTLELVHVREQLTKLQEQINAKR